MTIACFLDTNILIYAAMGRTDERPKQTIALKLLESAEFALSGQVLAEFVANALHPKRQGVPLKLDEVHGWLKGFSAYPIQPITIEIVLRGAQLARSYQIKYWDAALIAACEQLEAPILYTEDLSHRQLYGSVRVINPFRQD